MNRIRLCLVLLLLGFVATYASGQTNGFCIIDQPLPAWPKEYGALDSQTSVLFLVEFSADGTIGKIDIIHGTHFQGLDDAARDAVRRISFRPQVTDGTAVSVRKGLTYSYSWRNPGWKIVPLAKNNYCSKPTVPKLQNSAPRW
jgi:TonB family protein